jgi:hypothetical protein
MLVHGHEREEHEVFGLHVVDRVQHLVAAPVADDGGGFAVRCAILRRSASEEQEPNDRRDLESHFR